MPLSSMSVMHMPELRHGDDKQGLLSTLLEPDDGPGTKWWWLLLSGTLGGATAAIERSISLLSVCLTFFFQKEKISISFDIIQP